MRRPCSLRAVLSVGAALCCFMAGGVVAQAQGSGAQPEITSAPGRVGFNKTAVIEGRLRYGTPGDEVSLQHRRLEGGWRTLDTKAVNEELEARFAVTDMRRTGVFRLAYTDPVSGLASFSDKEKVRVRSRLSARLSRKHLVVGRKVKVRGRLQPGFSGRTVRIEQRRGGAWRLVKKVRTTGGGYFSASFRPQDHGRRKVRALFRGDGRSTRSSKARRMRVYRLDLATWYGPGLYGNRTACGQTLTSSTLGVAHRSLPCGTAVSILYGGRTVTVPVIDRGPYTSANWDLTSRTAERVGFSGKEHIGVTH